MGEKPSLRIVSYHPGVMYSKIFYAARIHKVLLYVCMSTRSTLWILIVVVFWLYPSVTYNIGKVTPPIHTMLCTHAYNVYYHCMLCAPDIKMGYFGKVRYSYACNTWYIHSIWYCIRSLYAYVIFTLTYYKLYALPITVRVWVAYGKIM